MQLKIFKNGAVVMMDRQTNGYYLLKLRAPNGTLVDRLLCDDYQTAVEYRRDFSETAKKL